LKGRRAPCPQTVKKAGGGKVWGNVIYTVDVSQRNPYKMLTGDILPRGKNVLTKNPRIPQYFNNNVLTKNPRIPQYFNNNNDDNRASSR